MRACVLVCVCVLNSLTFINEPNLPAVVMNGDCLCLQGWYKGVVFINGKNLGRYWSIGPQQALYLPGPWLRRGENEVVFYLFIHILWVMSVSTCTFTFNSHFYQLNPVDTVHDAFDPPLIMAPEFLKASLKKK